MYQNSGKKETRKGRKMVNRAIDKEAVLEKGKSYWCATFRLAEDTELADLGLFRIRPTKGSRIGLKYILENGDEYEMFIQSPSKKSFFLIRGQKWDAKNGRITLTPEELIYGEDHPENSIVEWWEDMVFGEEGPKDEELEEIELEFEILGDRISVSYY